MDATPTEDERGMNRVGDRVDLLTRKPFEGPFVVRLRRSREQAHPAPGEAEHEWGPALATALWVGGDEHGHP